MMNTVPKKGFGNKMVSLFQLFAFVLLIQLPMSNIDEQKSNQAPSIEQN